MVFKRENYWVPKRYAYMMVRIMSVLLISNVVFQTSPERLIGFQRNMMAV